MQAPLQAQAPAPASPVGRLLRVDPLATRADRPAARDRADEAVDWRFPLVSADGATAAAVAARINFLLFVLNFDDGYSEAMPPADPRRTLRAAGPFARRNLPTLDYRVTRHDARVLAFAFTGESCGAYCEDFRHPVAFDARTGRTLVDQDLFEPAGRRAMLAEAARANTARIEANLARLRAERRAAPTQRPADRRDWSRAWYDDAIALLEDCREQWRDPTRPGSDASLEIRERDVVVRHGRCSNHAMRALDPLGDFANVFPVERLRPWLGAYGREVLLGEATPPAASGAPSWPAPQAWHGVVGDRPVTLYLARVDPVGNRVFGYYFYDRWRTAIPLAGERDGDRMELRETTPGGPADARGPKPDGTLSLTLRGDGLTGHWRGGGGRGGEIRVLDVALDGAFPPALPQPASPGRPR